MGKYCPSRPLTQRIFDVNFEIKVHGEASYALEEWNFWASGELNLTGGPSIAVPYWQNRPTQGVTYTLL